MSFMKKGFREHKLFERKKVKNHTKEFYKILGRVKNIAVELREEHPELEFTEENIQEYASPKLGRELDSMEQFLLLGNLYNGPTEETKDNTEEH